MEDDAAIAEFGWNKDDCYDVADKIKAFLDAQAAYKADDSRAKRIVKDEKCEVRYWGLEAQHRRLAM